MTSDKVGRSESRLDEAGRGTQSSKMKALSGFVSLHPYFKVHPGKLDAFKAGFPAFVEKTASEEKNLFYEFTVNGDEVFCREGYADAEGLLVPLENIGVPGRELRDLQRETMHRSLLR